jgi:hypothetical protein
VAKKPIKKPYSICVGNGTSRKGKDLKQFNKKKKTNVIACNWFFDAEFIPDILVCSDEPITKEIIKYRPNMGRSQHFYSWYPKKGSGMKKPGTPEKFGAGGSTIQIAADDCGSSHVFMVGMDFYGFGGVNPEQNGKLNNMFGGKKHYVPADSPAPTYRNWERRYQWVFREYPDVQFWHVDPFEGRSPERLRGFANFHSCTFENMEAFINDGDELIDTTVKTEEDVKRAYELNPNDVKACFERQIAGQENVIWKDMMNPKQVLKLRLQANERYLQSPNSLVTCEVEGFEGIIIPKNVIISNGKSRISTNEELQKSFIKELKERDDILKNSKFTPFDLKKHPDFERVMQEVKSKNELPPPPKF